MTDFFQGIAVAFHVDFEQLPAEAQEIYMAYRGNNNHAEFKNRVDTLLRDRVLDSFIARSEHFRRAAASLFGERHPYLQRPDWEGEMLSIIQSQKQNQGVSEGQGTENAPTLPSLPDFTGPFQPRPRPLESSKFEQVSEGMDVDEGIVHESCKLLNLLTLDRRRRGRDS